MSDPLAEAADFIPLLAQEDLETGACPSSDRHPTIRTFPLAVRDGMIAVQVPHMPPTAEELPLPSIG